MWDGSRSGLVAKGKHGAVGSTLVCITPLIINRDYLFYFLRLKFDELNKNTTGASIPHIDPNRFFNLQVPVPPEEEQLLIVSSLEKQLRIYESEFKDLNSELFQLEEYRTSVLSEAFNGELTKSWRKSNGIRKNWPKAKLVDTSQIIMGNSPPGNSYNDTGDGTPLINGPTEFGSKPWSILKQNNIRKYTTAPTKMCKKGDLIICVRGFTTGRTNIAGIKACIGRGVAAIRANENQSFINWFLIYKQSEIFNDALIGVTTFPNISSEYLGNIEIQLPDQDEQQEIVNMIERSIKNTEEMEEAYKRRIVDNDELQNAVLQMAFTGELVENYKGAISERDFLAEIEAARTSKLQQIKDTKTKQLIGIKKFFMNPKDLGKIREEMKSLFLKRAREGVISKQDVDVVKEQIQRKVPDFDYDDFSKLFIELVQDKIESTDQEPFFVPLNQNGHLFFKINSK